ncbi:hypothetical protein [Emticicia sp. C21]|uniref:hypothetical protein n=1 Tax=Emticicia sp. C21 TaxID=2302915 RepID=UPI000E34FB53|nr:hypothetical protein [Emticicia sp. C21]RFS15549.1 hypothetical protein D0T08_15475 [Emticicia sp. C21]
MADVVSIIPGESTEGKLLAQTSKSQTSRAVKAVIAETNAGKGNITSSHTLTEAQALEAGVNFAGNNAKEIGQSGSGVYRSQTINKDGTVSQYKMDAFSIAGSHRPNVPHVHLEIINPTNNKMIVNHHIPIIP